MPNGFPTVYLSTTPWVSFPLWYMYGRYYSSTCNEVFTGYDINNAEGDLYSKVQNNLN